MRVTTRAWRGRWILAGLGTAVLVAVVVIVTHHNHRALRFIRPDAVSAQPDSKVLNVRFPWHESGFCAGQFSVKVSEGTRRVLIGDVVDHPTGDNCLGLGSYGEHAWVQVTLSAPLGRRQPVRLSDGATLPPASF